MMTKIVTSRKENLFQIRTAAPMMTEILTIAKNHCLKIMKEKLCDVTKNWRRTAEA